MRQIIGFPLFFLHFPSYSTLRSRAAGGTLLKSNAFVWLSSSFAWILPIFQYACLIVPCVSWFSLISLRIPSPPCWFPLISIDFHSNRWRFPFDFHIFPLNSFWFPFDTHWIPLIFLSIHPPCKGFHDFWRKGRVSKYSSCGRNGCRGQASAHRGTKTHGFKASMLKNIAGVSEKGCGQKIKHAGNHAGVSKIKEKH